MSEIIANENTASTSYAALFDVLFQSIETAEENLSALQEKVKTVKAEITNLAKSAKTNAKLFGVRSLVSKSGKVKVENVGGTYVVTFDNAGSFKVPENLTGVEDGGTE